MTDEQKAYSLAEKLIEEELSTEETIVGISKLASYIDNMKLKDANALLKYMKEMALENVPAEKRDLIRKLL